MKEGKVYLVGAGPGDPELLTRKAWRVLQAADVILHDDLVSPQILSLLPASARVVNVGKRCGAKMVSQDEVNERMVGLARAGHVVARLKNGDPMVFGRGSEEITALRQAGIEFEVVPGVTAVLGAAASARVPLTDRRHTSRVVFMTIHRAGQGNAADDASKGTDQENQAKPQPPSDPGTTYVIYMPGSRYAELAAELATIGVPAGTPCLLVAHATLPDEAIYRTTVEHLANSPIAAAPSLLIVGEVAAEYGLEAPGANAINAGRAGTWSAEILNFVMQPGSRRGRNPIEES